jgi:citronellol/citronellal dehydrogenase
VACGANVLITGRRAEVLEAAADELGCLWLAGDVREPGDCARLVDEALERFGRLDTLVNNAGGQYFVPAESIALKGWQAVTRLNVGATLSMAEAAYSRAMRPAGTGMVVNVTLSPHHGLAGMTHSSAARAAVEGLTRDLARAWAGDGVAVTAAAAGHFETEAIQKYPDVVRLGAARSVPLQRLGRPEEHAWLIALLASPLGRRLSGATITLDGARDNWFGPWPPKSLVDESGDVPTEARVRR